MAGVGYKPFFTEESYTKYSVFPSLLDFIKQKDLELNGPLVSKLESPKTKKSGSDQKKPSGQWKDILCKGKKKKQETVHIPYLYPAVAFPRLSWLTKDEQKKFLELMEKYGSPMRPGSHVTEHKELLLLRDLQKKVLAEQAEYIKYLQNAAYKLQKDYTQIAERAEDYITEMLESRTMRVHRYPRFYVQHDSVPLRTAKIVREIPFFHIKTLLNLGSVPEFVPIVGGKNALKNKLQCDVKKLKKVIPPNSSEVSDKQVCSEDKIAEQLALKHRVQVVISASALNCLVDNHEPYQRQWEIPIVVRELHEKLESGQTHTYKVVFIDKPFIQKHMTVRDRNQTFHKVSLKYAYTHATHAGSFMKVPDANGNDIEFKYKEKDVRKPATDESYEEEMFVDDSADASSSLVTAEIEDLETFGTGPSKKPKLSIHGDLGHKKVLGLKSPSSKEDGSSEGNGNKTRSTDVLISGKERAKTQEDIAAKEGIVEDSQRENINIEDHLKDSNEKTMEGMELTKDKMAKAASGSTLIEDNDALTKDVDVNPQETNDGKKANKMLEGRSGEQLDSTCSETESDALVIESDCDSTLQMDLTQCDGCGDEESDNQVPQYDGPSEVRKSKKGKLKKGKAAKQRPTGKKTIKTSHKTVVKKHIKKVKVKKGRPKTSEADPNKQGTLVEDEKPSEQSEDTRKFYPKRGQSACLKSTGKIFHGRRYGLKMRKMSLTTKKSLKQRKVEERHMVKAEGQIRDVSVVLDSLTDEFTMETRQKNFEKDTRSSHEQEQKTCTEARSRRNSRRSRASFEGNIVMEEKNQSEGGPSDGLKMDDHTVKKAEEDSRSCGKGGKVRRKSTRDVSKDGAILQNDDGKIKTTSVSDADESKRRSMTGKVRRKSSRGMIIDRQTSNNNIRTEETVDTVADISDHYIDSEDGKLVIQGTHKVDVQPTVRQMSCKVIDAEHDDQNMEVDTIKVEVIGIDNVTAIKEDSVELDQQPVKRKRGRPPKKSLDQKQIQEEGVKRKGVRQSISVEESFSGGIRMKKEDGKLSVNKAKMTSESQKLPDDPVQKKKRGRPRKSQVTEGALDIKPERDLDAGDKLETEITGGNSKNNKEDDTQKTSVRQNTRYRRSLSKGIHYINDLCKDEPEETNVNQMDSKSQGQDKDGQGQNLSGVQAISKRKRGGPPLSRSVSDHVTSSESIKNFKNVGVVQKRKTRSQLRSLSQDGSLETSIATSSKQSGRNLSAIDQRSNLDGLKLVETQHNVVAEADARAGDVDTEPELEIDVSDRVAEAKLEELQEDLDLSVSESGSDVEELRSPGGGKKSRRLYFSDEDSEEEERRRAQKAQKKWIDSVRQAVKKSQPVRRSSDPKQPDSSKASTEENADKEKKPAIKVKSGTKKLFEDMDQMPARKPARKNLPTLRRKPQSLPKYKPQNEELDEFSVTECLPETKPVPSHIGKAGKKLSKGQHHQMASAALINLQLRQRILKRRANRSKLGQKETETTNIEIETKSETTKIESESIASRRRIPIKQIIQQPVEENESLTFISAPESPEEHFKLQSPPLSPTPERVTALTPNSQMEKDKGPKVIPLERNTLTTSSNVLTIDNTEALHRDTKRDQEQTDITQLKLGIPSGITPLRSHTDISSPDESSSDPTSHMGVTEGHAEDHSAGDMQSSENISDFHELSKHPPIIQRHIFAGTDHKGKNRSGDYKSNISSDGLIIPTQRKTRVSLVTDGAPLHRDTSGTSTFNVPSIKPTQTKDAKSSKTRVKTKTRQNETGVGILDRLLPVKDKGSAVQVKQLQGQQEGTTLDNAVVQGKLCVPVPQSNSSLGSPQVPGKTGELTHQERRGIEQSRTKPMDSHSIKPSSVTPQYSALSNNNTVFTSEDKSLQQVQSSSGLAILHNMAEHTQHHQSQKVHGPCHHQPTVHQHSQEIHGPCHQQIAQRREEGGLFNLNKEVKDHLMSPPREASAFVQHQPYPLKQAPLYQAPLHVRDPKEWEMYEDPKDFESPKKGNVTYNLWQLGKFRVLVRCGVHAVKPLTASDKKVNFLHFHPKLEYQRYHGYEQLTMSEISRSWINLAIRPHCHLYRVRIAFKNSEVLTEEEVDISQVLASSGNFSPKASLDVMEGVFNKLCSLHPGHYLLGHAPGNAQAHIKKTTQSQVGVYNLHVAYCNLHVDREGVPWIPVDPNIKLPFHKLNNRVPCTFEPKDTDNAFFKRDQDDKKFNRKGNKNKKKGKMGQKKK